MADLSGAPKIVGEIVNYSTLASTVKKGIICMPIVCERGEPGKVYYIGSTNDIRRYLGREVFNKDIYVLNRAVKRGAAFYVTRIAHYSNLDAGTLAGGATASATIVNAGNTLTLAGKALGAGYNGIVVTLVAAVSGLANSFDITISVPNFPELTKTIFNVHKTFASGITLAQLNGQSEYVNFTLTSGELTAGTGTLSGGTYLTGDIVATDIIGSGVSQVGIHAFNVVKDASRICVPGYSDPTIDIALKNYCEGRQDMRFHIRTPLGIDAATIVNYRQGTGAYSHTAIDSWFGSLWTGGLKSKDPSSDLPLTHSEIADIMVSYAKKDIAEKVHESPSMDIYSKINDSDVLGVAVDFGIGSLSSQWDLIVNNGVNALIIGTDGYPKLHGNRTLSKNGGLLTKENNAEYVLSLFKRVKAAVQLENFVANDPIMWLSLYNRIKPILNADVKARAIREDWQYIGDQFVDVYTDATFNNINDIDNGKYKFRIMVKPISATEYFGFEIGVVNGNVNFELVTI